MVRVLHVISGLGVGGAESMLVQLANALAARGGAQHVVSLTGAGPMADRLAPDVGLTTLTLRGRGAPAALWTIRQCAARLRPDVIQGWMYHGDLAATFAHRTAPGRPARRLYWGVRCSNMDDARYGRLLAIWRRLSAIPDAVIANSHAGAAAHVARARRMVVIPNGVDSGRFRPDPAARAAMRAALGIAPDARVVVMAARVDPMKDHPAALALAKATPQAVFLFAGLGTDALALPPNARGLGSRGDMARLFAAGDVILSTSAYGEGFSNAIAEGMAAGLVPVVTDVGDAAAMVGETGAVAPPGAVAELSAALTRTLALPDAALGAARAAAAARMAGCFSITAAIDAFAALYAEQG